MSKPCVLSRFSVEPSSGVITVVECSTPGAEECLDYETRNTYFLSLQVQSNVLCTIYYYICVVTIIIMLGKYYYG